MGNPITWFEILGKDPEKTASFYSELFGWHTETVEGGYILIDTHSGRGMNGGIMEPPPQARPGTLFYAQDPDIQKVLDKANELGGQTRMPVTEKEMVTFAVFSDPWGNAVGLTKGEGDAPVSAGDNPAVDWVEIGCAEPEKAYDFYRELFGWTIDRDMSGDGGGGDGGGPVHGSFDTGSMSGARGGIGSSRDGQPHVDIYASVDDLTKYLERAEGLGAKTAMPAMKVDEHTEIGMFVDPQGTGFGLYSFTD
jgi:predicted enzyme related to lactoylglutathione lyase